MFRTSWFEVQELDPGVHLISEPGHVNSFLIQGNKSAILFDTGLGVANIRKVAEELSNLPLLVVNSHYHFDHTGGNRLFKEIAIHRVGAPLLQQPSAPELAEKYMAYTQRMLKAWGPYKEADDIYFHLLTTERMIRPLPEGFDPASYQVVPTIPTQLLEEGDVLDLGGRRLQVMHTPGHSPDCICLFDEQNSLLFGGDTINTGPIYAQLEDSDVEAFAKSTARLATLADTVRRVFVCHFLRVENHPALLHEIAEGFQRLLAGEVFFRDNVDCLNYPVKEACFDHFSIFIPARESTRI
ncbi:MAG TPA: MBL fold metallo-hydrolase [Ktedonobacteraceae bacterium]|jgi:glyoxylase-like metal-dependent hydrolase (beta-lactamase superfamily II)|nr:MBL fold metallo-hydrolase [Ktedonobacteraceae bacterium]